MNFYNQFVASGYNCSESSDSSNASQQSSPHVYDYSNENIINQRNNKYDTLNDCDMSDDSMNLNESILTSKNLNTDIYKPPVNRGGRKQVKLGTTKRNARERNRVRYINNCFEILREHIPFEVVDEQKNRKLSKVETLKYATLYIKQLTDLLESTNCENVKIEPQYLDNIQTNSSLSYNNININIYNTARSSNDLYSPTLSTSSTSSSSLSSYNQQYQSTGYLEYNDSFNYKKSNNNNYFNYDQQTNWSHQHHNQSNHYNKW